MPSFPRADSRNKDVNQTCSRPYDEMYGELVLGVAGSVARNRPVVG